jgi:exopolysaccharide biosynthesis polyprenyl glycosylphosphotransferase
LGYIPIGALALDLILVTAVVLVAVWGRERLGIFHTPADVSAPVTVIGPFLIASWLLLIAISGGYHNDVFGAGTDEYKRLFRAILLTAGLLGVGCYMAGYQLARGFFVLTFVLGTPALIVGRLVLRRAIQRARGEGKLQFRVVISGLPSHVDEVATVLNRESWLGYRVVGALTPATDLMDTTPSGVPVVGACEAATELVKDLRADVIFFASGALTSSTELRRIAWDLARAEVQVIVAPRVTDVSGERVRIRPVGGLPLMHIDPPRWTDAARLSKRFFDLVGALILLTVFSPLLALAALQIRSFDGGPAFFRQKRVGRDGVAFNCLKLRTMVIDAEDRLPDLRAATGHDGRLFKMKEDPRVTKPGHWLRRYSLDELPQLINVLRGEMSLVGPRPPLPREVEDYEAEVHHRLRVRPGMTGLWQVSGRSDLSWDEAVRLDLYYVDNWSMLQDLSILMKTFAAVLRSRGAY